MKKTLIIIIAAVVVASGVAAYFIFFRNSEPKEVRIAYVPGEFFVTNVKDSKYLLKTTIVLELNKEGMEEYLTDNNHMIRDIIIFILREKTEEELRSTGIENQLRTEIVEKIMEEMGIDYIATLYFNDYVLQ